MTLTSTRIIASSWRRVRPSARSTPMSPRRCSTEKLTELKIRNRPTSSASRLIAVRLVMKAWLIAAVARVRPAADSTWRPSGNAACSASSAAWSPSSMRTSMRDSQPSSPSHSCAVAMSATSSRSRLPESSPGNTARSSAARALPAATSSNGLPGCRPRSAAVCAEVVTTPGVVRKPTNSDSASSVSASPVKLRSSRSAKRSTPSSVSDSPFIVTVPSTTGAMASRPWSTRRAAYTSSRTPRGPPMTWCVASPVIESIDIRKALRALALARSTATMTATPTPMPSRARASCHGCRSR